MIQNLFSRFTTPMSSILKRSNPKLVTNPFSKIRNYQIIICKTFENDE